MKFKSLTKDALFWICIAAFLLFLGIVTFSGCYYSKQEVSKATNPVAPPDPDDDGDRVNCVAAFGWALTPGTMSVAFENQTLPRACSEFIWSFGDGTGQSRERSPVHRYPAAGNYVARVVACPEGNFEESQCSDASATVIVPSP